MLTDKSARLSIRSRLAIESNRSNETRTSDTSALKTILRDERVKIAVKH